MWKFPMCLRHINFNLYLIVKNIVCWVFPCLQISWNVVKLALPFLSFVIYRRVTKSLAIMID